MNNKIRLLAVIFLLLIMSAAVFLNGCSSENSSNTAGGTLLSGLLASTEISSSANTDALGSDNSLLGLGQSPESPAHESTIETSGEKDSSSKAKTLSSESPTSSKAAELSSVAGRESSISSTSSEAVSSYPLIIYPENETFEVPSTMEYHKGNCEVLTALRRNKAEVNRCRTGFRNNEFCYIADDAYSPCKICNPEKITYFK